MNGMIRTDDALRLQSMNGHEGQSVFDLLGETMSDPKFMEIVESVQRYGITSPVLIREERVCNGTHRISVAFYLGLTEVPFTDDPEIGWAHEFEWPEEKEACHE